MTNKESLREKWKQFTEDDTKNPNGLSFVIMSEDEQTIFDFFWNKIEQIRKEDMERVAKKIESKRPKNVGIDNTPEFWINEAIDDILTIIKQSHE